MMAKLNFQQALLHSKIILIMLIWCSIINNFLLLSVLHFFVETVIQFFRFQKNSLNYYYFFLHYQYLLWLSLLVHLMCPYWIKVFNYFCYEKLYISLTLKWQCITVCTKTKQHNNNKMFLEQHLNNDDYNCKSTYYNDFWITSMWLQLNY